MEEHGLLTGSHGLFSLLIHPRTTFLGMVPPTAGWALPYQSLVKIMSHRLAYRSSDGGVSQLRFLFPDNFSLCQVDKDQAGQEHAQQPSATKSSKLSWL